MLRDGQNMMTDCRQKRLRWKDVDHYLMVLLGERSLDKDSHQKSVHISNFPVTGYLKQNKLMAAGR